jgi:hypothetical protein
MERQVRPYYEGIQFSTAKQGICTAWKVTACEFASLTPMI